jgi:hypothetical protein
VLPTALCLEERRMKILAPVLSLLIAAFSPGSVAQTKKPFTVADDIGYTHFVPDGYSEGYTGSEGMMFSPNGDFFAVLAARGRLDLNQVEESLRFYRSRDIQDFLNHPEQSQPPSPLWIVNRLAKKEPVSNFRWLSDSSGVVILEHTDNQDDRISLADLRNKKIEVLPGTVAYFDGFDVADRDHYVYVAVDETARKGLEEKREAERRAPMMVYTGPDAWDYLMPNSPGVIRRLIGNRKHLWAAVDGKRSEVTHDGSPLTPADFDSHTLALSPDGKWVVTELYEKNIPQSWERLYPPPYPTADNNIHNGKSVLEYVRVNLTTGEAQPLTGAPISDEAGWASQGSGQPTWSSDGKAILLPGTFIKSSEDQPSRPCVAVVDVTLNTATCVEELKSRTGPGLIPEKDYHWIWSVRFVGGDRNQVQINYMKPDESDTGTIEYVRTHDGNWQVNSHSLGGMRQTGHDGLQIKIEQRVDQPPVLLALDTKTSRIIWDPNPQFNDLDLGNVRVYRWKDKEGRDWKGGLYMPAGYQARKRYPLVIQTHGFSESWFTPSGSFPTAFAAREMAARGIAVLQIGGSENCAMGPTEASCEVSGFESGARQLAADGLVDLQNLGYIGFSRSCWYGMKFLTSGSLPLRAALLADGTMAGYFEFILDGIDFHDEIGAKPYGTGLETWVKNAPGFHMDKVTAPVLIAVEREGAIGMWEPYAGLRYLKKPVELDLLNTDEHVITNPVERMASQGLSVDWFRFWLQNFEDPTAAKADQYKRWRELKQECSRLECVSP